MKAIIHNTGHEADGIAAGEKKDIDDTDLRAVVANITGIPIGKIQTSEQQKLVNMEDHLRHALHHSSITTTVRSNATAIRR